MNYFSVPCPPHFAEEVEWKSGPMAACPVPPASAVLELENATLYGFTFTRKHEHPME